MALNRKIITDRVAENDNRYSYVFSGTDKITLIPAPTNIVEEGTPLNKATLQPLFDEKVEKIFLVEQQGGTFSCEDGSDLQSVFAFIAEKRNVRLFVKAYLFAWELEFTPYYFSSTEIKFTAPNPLAGTSFGETIAEGDLLLSIASDGTVKLTEMFSVDRIIENGQSNGWTYRIWESGRAECWGVFPITFDEVPRQSFANGTLFKDAKSSPNFPFSFSSQPVVVASCGTVTFDWVNATVSTNSVIIQRYGDADSFSVLPTLPVSIFVTGKR